MGNALESLLQTPHIWRGNQYARVAFESIPTGFSHLDTQLPGGGWPRAALTEILASRQGIGELSLLMPALSRLSKGKEWIAWIAPPHIPYAPALSREGISLSKVIVVHTPSEQEKIWAAEKCLRSQSCSAVLLWACTHTHQACRRLQLAAEAGRAWGVLFGPSQWARHTSPAALRLLLAPEQGRLKVHLLKRRGGGTLPEIFIDELREQAPAGDPPRTVATPFHHRSRQQVA
ncbi:MAG: translesion DNA synthesis-associated protein ImuA [Betaproteobacteria bacterium]|nr:translesion DNA synthesis-associated protein ImuA [Betaproteobacteria bacterium]